MKRFATERHGVESRTSFEEILRSVERPRPPAESPSDIGIVGAGPAGLSCAHDLRLMGHRVTVYEASPVAGGMLRLGIPAYRLPRDLLQAEVEFIRWLGVNIRYGVRVGQDIEFEALRSTHDALFLATGCGKGRRPPLPGGDLAGVYSAVDFLAAVNLERPLDVGARVLVVGGGNVAFDAARTARRHAADQAVVHPKLAIDAAMSAARVLRRDVTLVSLESADELPADPEELQGAALERVQIQHRRAVKTILGADGRVRGVVTLAVRRVFDDAGRFAPETIPSTEEELACDTVVFATGQVADLDYLPEDAGPRVSPRSTLEVDAVTLATSQQGVFAGGDVVSGPRIAIEAVADGRRAARAIDSVLAGRGDAPQAHIIKRFSPHGYAHPFARGDYEHLYRDTVPEVEGEARLSFKAVELGYDESNARREGARCLHCWINTEFDSRIAEASECIQCRGCIDVCPEGCIDLVGALRLDAGRSNSGNSLGPATEQIWSLQFGLRASDLERDAAPALIKDETRCIRCGLCARKCPVGCVRMEGHYRVEEIDLVRLADDVI